MDAGHVDPVTGHDTWLGDGAVAESSERYASMFTHHPHAAFSVDPRGYYTAANARALAMTGLSLRQMRETHFSQVIHPDDVHLLEDAFDRVLLGKPQIIEARVVRNDGEIIDIRCTAIPVVVGGEVIGVHGISEDITEARRLVRELEEANAAKSLFLATVSHEIRTPLAVLMGATDLLMSADLPPEPDHYAHMVHRASERMMRLVEDILEFSGLETHRIVLRPQPFQVRTLLEDVASWAVPLAESQNLVLSLVVDESVPTTTVGDAMRINQVVTNLVQNAIAFTESGTVDVRVSCGTAPAAAGLADARDTWVDFAVTDTGVGIAQDQQEPYFQPFKQAHPHLARGTQGVGLGLAICRELADLMEGQLVVVSTVGEGSTFTFGVPLGHSPAEDADEEHLE